MLRWVAIMTHPPHSAHMGQTIQTKGRGGGARDVTLDAKREKWALEANGSISAN